MLKEIEEPLETIHEFFLKRRASKSVKKEFNTNLSEYDVYFKEDTALVKELAEKCNIDYNIAEQICIAFFEEIKRQMIDGNIVNMFEFGKFYLNGLHKNNKGKVVIPPKKCRCYPKFKASVIFKRFIARNS